MRIASPKCAILRRSSWDSISWSISAASITTERTRVGRLSIIFTGCGHRCALRLKTNVGEEKSELPTVTGVWRTADWHEREIFDMMGIVFRKHPDLRRILMWDSYPYYPLRKDFPLAGKPTSIPEVAFTKPAPMEGGPFVTIAGEASSTAREPRVRVPETNDVESNARLERRRDIKETLGKSQEQDSAKTVAAPPVKK